jgi:signal recognition particle receptor subunit beta
MTNATYKIAFVGEPGSGKTTCIAALSEIRPFSTDVGCTDELALRKDTTTVAFDYGEMDLEDAGRLLLYGLPGQTRFRFMFDVVRDGLLGVVILVDATSTDPMRGFSETLAAYAEDFRDLPVVVGINKALQRPDGLMEQCESALRKHGLISPILCIDARQRRDIVRIFELLFMLLEYGPTFSVARMETT